MQDTYRAFHVNPKAKSQLLSPEDVQRMAGKPLKLMKYNEFAHHNDIEDCFGKYDHVLVMYMTTSEFRGHWCLLVRSGNQIQFFDSYGMFMDDQLDFSKDEQFKAQHNMYYPFLTKLLYKSPKVVNYNELQLQNWKSNTNTCGRWCALFAKLGLSVNEFQDLFRWFVNEGIADDVVTILTEI